MQQHFSHIAALRGVAILMVLLYHLAPKVCPHGYFGVNIFLLISGYLLVYGLLKKPEFKLLQFINKKILRIFPPLLCMVIPTALFALWAMTEKELLVAIETAFYSLLGCSNIFLDKETQGYFADNASYNPFLHTWYLGVVLQTYCIFALIGWLCQSFSNKVKWGVILSCGLGSIAYVFYHRFIQTEPMVPLYFQTWGRMVEVVGGACILLLPTIRNESIKSIFSIAAIAAVIYCCFSVNKYQELILVSTCILLWMPSTNWTGKIIDNPFFRFLGKYSFSIYLWHWPLIVYCNYITEHISYFGYILLFIICISIGILAFYAVEKSLWKLRYVVLVWLTSVCCLYFVLNTDNISKKLHPEVYEAGNMQTLHIQKVHIQDYDSANYIDWNSGSVHEIQSSNNPVCFDMLGNPSQRPSFIMMGDSHASAFKPGMAEIANKLNICGYYFPSYVTPFHNRMSGNSLYRFSGKQSTALFEWLKKHPEIKNIVLIQRWSIRLTEKRSNGSMTLKYDGTPIISNQFYEDTERAFVQFCRNLNQIGKRVFIMTEVPPVEANPGSYIRRALLHNHNLDTNLLSCTEEKYIQMFHRQLSTLNKLELHGICRVIHIEKRLFENGIFNAFKNNKVLMKDDDHISDAGGILYAQKYYEDWAKLQTTEE